MAGCFTYEITVRRVTRISRFTWYATLPLRFISLYSLQRDKLLVRASYKVRGERGTSVCMYVYPFSGIVRKENEHGRSSTEMSRLTRMTRKVREPDSRTIKIILTLRRSGCERHLSCTTPSIFHSSSIIGTFTRGRLSARVLSRYYNIEMSNTNDSRARGRSWAEAKIKSHVFARIITSYARNHYYSHQRAIISDFAREWVLWWFVRFQGNLRSR